MEKNPNLPPFIDIGIDCTDAHQDWDRVELLLSFEPYLEEIFAYWEGTRRLKLHLLGDHKHIASSLFCNHPAISSFEWHVDKEQYEASVAISLPDAQEFLNPPSVRTVPALGLSREYQGHETPIRTAYVLSDIVKELSIALPPQDIFSSEGEFTDYVRYHDILVTDSVGAALYGLAANVKNVFLLTTPEKAKLLPKGHDINLVPILSKFSLDACYESLLRKVEAFRSYWRKYPAEYMNRGDAKAWIQNQAMQVLKGKGLDVGSNKWPFWGALPSDVDSRKFEQAPFDFIFSSHCLEHIPNWQEELKLWRDSLDPAGGTIFVYLPHPAMEVWRPEGDWVKGGWHVWSPDPLQLAHHFRTELKLNVVEYSARPDSHWSFYMIVRNW